MIFTDRIILRANREEVYAALNDPDVLRMCIPGCDGLTKTGATAFDAHVALRIGPIAARFEGQILLDPSHPPETYALEARGGHGRAGQVRGRMDVTLGERDGRTVFDYRVEAQPTGLLARLGEGPLRTAAAWLARGFFRDFDRALGQMRAGTRRIAPLQPAALGRER